MPKLNPYLQRTAKITHQGSDEPIGMLDVRLHGHLVDIGYVLAKSEWGGAPVTSNVRRHSRLY